MVATVQPLTYLDLVKTPGGDGNRYELLDGEMFVTASPAKKHALLNNHIAYLLTAHVMSLNLGTVVAGPADVRLTAYDVVVPDIFFLSSARAHIYGEQYVEGPPDLIVEILSPSTRLRDLTKKLSLYARTGVTEYWVVDPEKSVITVHVLQPSATFAAILPIEGVVTSMVLPDLRLSLADVFEGVV